MKPVAAVTIEGTLTTGGDPDLFDFGEWLPHAITKLEKLRETHFVLLVSPSLRSITATKNLLARLHREAIPFDDIWCGDGVPTCAVRYDNEAKTL